MMSPEHQLLHGPVIPAVLKLLEQGSCGGYQIAVALRADCPEALSQGEASLYAALYYLEAHRLAAASWSEGPQGRRRVYGLTDRGRQRLADESRQWRALAPLLGKATNEGPDE